MAHTYGGGGRLPASGTTTSSNPATVSLNLPAGTTVLWVSIVCAGTTARAGGAPTFNSVALTAGNAKANAGGTPEECSEDWYMLSPPTGENYTLSIPNSGTLAMGIAYGYASAQANYDSVLDNTVSTPGNSTNPSTSFTVQDGAIWFGGVGNGATTWSPSGRSGTQINDWDAGSWGRGAQYGIKSGTGSQTVSWTFATSEDWIVQAISFKEQLQSRSGSLSKTLGALTSSASGAVTVTGSVSKTLSALTAASSGAVLVKGAATRTLNALTLVASGTVGDAAVSGSLDKTLGALTLSSSGAVRVSGSVAKTLGALTASSAGKVTVSGALSKTLGTLTASAAAKVIVGGAVSKTLGVLTLSAAGKATVSGALSKTLGALTLSAAGGVTVSGSLAKTLGAATASADGTVTDGPSGSLNATLGALTLSAAGTVPQPEQPATSSATGGGITRRRRQAPFFSRDTIPPPAPVRRASVAATLGAMTLSAHAVLGESPVKRRRRIAMKALLLS